MEEVKRCVICGHLFKAKSKRNVCCSKDCQEERNRQTNKRLYHERKKETEWLEKAQLIVESEKALGKDLYICERADKCKYGTAKTIRDRHTCDYITITGEPRVTLQELRKTGGWPCVCRKYEPR